MKLSYGDKYQGPPKSLFDTDKEEYWKQVDRTMRLSRMNPGGGVNNLFGAFGIPSGDQPHMFGAMPLPPELPPEQWTDTLRALLPDPATQWMQKRPPIVAPPPLPPDRQQHLSTMQRRFGY